MNASIHVGLSGATLAPVMATQMSALGKAGQSGIDVPQCRLSHLAIDMNRGRERRVHQHDARYDAGIQVVVDVRGVEPGRGDRGKKVAKDAGTALCKFVENERGAGEFSKDGKKAGAGRRFQNDVGGVDRGSDAGDVCQSNRRGELLEGLLSSDRRVCVGRRLAILSSIGSMAAGDAALARMAAPYRRRNRTVAASQAS